MSWELKKLSDCCTFIADGDHQAPPKAASGIPFVTISNINMANQFDFTNTMFVPHSYYDSLDSKRKAQKGDILYSVVGSFGIPVYMRETIPFVFQRHIAILRPNSTILPQFLYYTMLSRDFHMMADAAAIGAAQRTISLTALRKIKIAVPQMDIQKRIVNVLSAYDSLIENNQKQIKLLEEAAQRLYKEWFVDLRFPDHETTPVVDGVPEGWAYKPLSEVFDYIRGKSYSSKELSDTIGVLMVNLKSIRAFGGYNRNAEKRFIGQYKENQVLSSGDVIMGVTDMTQERRLVGHAALIPDMGEKMIFSMDLIKLIPKLTNSLFLYSALYYGGLSKQISPLANGVNVLHLKPEAMMKIKLLIPCERVLKQYCQLFSSIVARIEFLQKQCDVAAEARDRLLPKLMSGEIEV
ncbi:MAG: restriction endonuclease subunit S [Oscillospiraceae bacterium]|nr:restriction endonuclease subunit S [Oscillospiraceae bacterium]